MFFKSKSPWVKIGPTPGGHLFSFYVHVYSTNLKNLLLKNSNSYSLDIWHETSSSECLPSSNKSPLVKIVYIEKQKNLLLKTQINKNFDSGE
jgi:hypothetical protein